LLEAPIEFDMPKMTNHSFETSLDGYLSAEEEHKIEAPDFHDTTWDS